MPTAFLTATASLTDGQFFVLVMFLVAATAAGTVVIVRSVARTARRFHRAGLVRVARATREGWL